MASPTKSVKHQELESTTIIAKYIRGRSPDAPIDPWEDPSYSLYAQTDYYGFIHEDKIPTKYEASLAKTRKNDIKRETKWRKMIDMKTKTLLQYHKGRPSEKMTRRVYKGIPQAFRMFVWPIFLDIENVKQQQRGIYKQMLDRALAKSPDIRQIDLDVNRTFRDTTYFRERYGDRQRALFNVLVAYSMYNLEIGYCQGMSQLAGLMLIYLTDEEDAFWGLSQLMTRDKYMMHGCFIPEFPKLRRFFNHFDKILARFAPKLRRHFMQHDVDTSIFALKWFMQCFLDRVPMSLCMRVWDIYLMEGERVLIAMAYNIIKMHKKRLLRMDQNQAVMFFQQDLPRDFLYDDDQAIDSLKECLEELRKARLDLPPPPEGSDENPQKPFGWDPEATPPPEIVRGRQGQQADPVTAFRNSMRRSVSPDAAVHAAQILNQPPPPSSSVANHVPTNGEVATSQPAQPIVIREQAPMKYSRGNSDSLIGASVKMEVHRHSHHLVQYQSTTTTSTTSKVVEVDSTNKFIRNPDQRSESSSSDVDSNVDKSAREIVIRRSVEVTSSREVSSGNPDSSRQSGAPINGGLSPDVSTEVQADGDIGSSQKANKSALVESSPSETGVARSESGQIRLSPSALNSLSYGVETAL